MEKIMRQSRIFSVLCAVVLTVVCASLALASYALGDFRAALFCVILEICGLFAIDAFQDATSQQVEEIQ